MLQHLYIKNFILIDEITIDFTSGLSVFTGETGAGKSIILDAISLLMGERANSSLVRNNTPKAIIEGVFDKETFQTVFPQFEDAGFDMDDDVVIITREITSDGKSSAKINHRSVQASFLKNTVGAVLDIHSQHETQYLLQSKYHLNLLDAYHQDKHAIEEVEEAYTTYQTSKTSYDELLNSTYTQEDLDFFTVELDTIKDVLTYFHEEEEIEERLKLAQDATNHQEHFQQVYNSLQQESDVLSALRKATMELKEIDTETTTTMVERWNDFYFTLEEDLQTLKDISYENYIRPEELEELKEKKQQIFQMKKRYGSTVEEIEAARDERNEKVEFILKREHMLVEKKEAMNEALQIFETKAQHLSNIRKKASEGLIAEVLTQLREVMLPNAQFSIEFSQKNGSKQGIDDIRFLISMNPGEQLQPLQKVASGGELSRFMLAMKVVFTKLQGIATIIFDEIDTGVSGQVAFCIGEKMKELGEYTQVFSITHLAPVAAHAKQHYYVYKEQTSETTNTFVKELVGDEIVEELAMMSSGSISDVTIAGAKELLEKAKQV